MVNPDWRLLEDCGGLIEEIAMALPPHLLDGRDTTDDQILQALQNLTASFHPDMRLILLTEERSRAKAEKFMASPGIKAAVEIISVPNGDMRPTAFWIQDSFHVRYYGQERRLEHAHSENAGRHAEWLGSRLGIPSGIFDFHLAGGNQLVGPDFRLVGFRSIELSTRAANDPEAQCRAFGLIRDIDPRPLHLFGFRASDLSAASLPHRRSSPHQTGFHVDMFVSLTGKQRDGQPIIVVADPLSPTHPDTAQVVNAKRQLDASAERLTRRGFAVLRNPVPYLVSANGKLMPRLYSNVLVENEVRAGQQRPLVWMPSFDDAEPLQVFDESNAGLWADLGFEVIRVAGWNPLAAINGGLRCATKVLRRRSPPQSAEATKLPSSDNEGL